MQVRFAPPRAPSPAQPDTRAQHSRGSARVGPVHATRARLPSLPISSPLRAQRHHTQLHAPTTLSAHTWHIHSHPTPHLHTSPHSSHTIHTPPSPIPTLLRTHTPHFKRTSHCCAWHCGSVAHCNRSEVQCLARDHKIPDENPFTILIWAHPLLRWNYTLPADACRLHLKLTTRCSTP